MAKKFKCDICNKKFTDRYNLVSHQNVHSTATPFACSQCSYQGKTKKYLARHTKQVHKEITGEHKCNVCGKFFHHQSNLKVHAMVHTGEKPHSCNVCGKTFRVTYSLNSHMLIHTNEKPFQCSFCEYACRDSSTLRKHQNKHMGLEKLYECNICNKGYKLLSALRVHIAEQHLDVDVRKYPCDQCDKVFKSTTNRKLHIDCVHKRALVCTCPICGCRLMNKNNLSTHMRSHLDERPFSCTHPGCKIAFKNKSSLKKHSVIHNPDLHFACSHCGRKFARKTHVQRHERVMHLERSRGVECNYCGSRFYSKNYLVKHIQTKHVYKHKFKYICDLCGLVTHNKPSIVMHLKYGHSNDNDMQCKICDNNIVYKKHLYLKLHYWNTHNIRYKITRKATNLKAAKKEKVDQPTIEIKVEPIEADSYEEIQLLDVHKLEQEEEMDECKEYSRRVLAEDMAHARAATCAPEKDFDACFVRHVVGTTRIDPAHEAIKNDGIDEKQNQDVKRRIKQILASTEKLEKAKALRERRKQAQREKKEREKKEAQLKVQREREELHELARVREMYNERMKAAVAKQNERKEKVKITYFKIPEGSNDKNNKITEENSMISAVNELETSTDDKTVSNDNTPIGHRNNTENNAINHNIDVTNDLSTANDDTLLSNDENNDSTANNDAILSLSPANDDAILSLSPANDKAVLSNDENNDSTANDDAILSLSPANDDAVLSNDQNNDSTVNDDAILSLSPANDDAVLSNDQNNDSTANDDAMLSLSPANYDAVLSNYQNNDSTVNDDAILSLSPANDDAVLSNDENNDSTANDDAILSLSPANDDAVLSNDQNNHDENNGSTKNLHETSEFCERNDSTQPQDADVQTNENISQECHASNENVNSKVSQTNIDAFDQPLLERRVRNRRGTKCHDNGVLHGVNDTGKPKKMEFKTYQCYVCFKLYETKEALMSHCQEHFDMCHSVTLSKCPICGHVSHRSIARHLKTEHDVTLRIAINKMKRTEDTCTYTCEANGTKVDVIPSISYLNKVASQTIDKKRREMTVQTVAKPKLVKIRNEWILEKETVRIEYDEIPELTDRDMNKLKVCDNDVDRLGQLSRLARKKDLKMMFPCFKCDRICQTFSALKLHKRRHEDNPTPFKPRVNKSNKKPVQVKAVELNTANRTAFPKAILNRHKCESKLKEFFESNIRGGDVEFWQFLKIFNKMDREKIKDFKDLENRSDFGNHLDYYKDVARSADNTEC